MTTSELAQEVFSIVEKKIRGTPSSFEFEMAYQARIATERIRFVIRLIEAARHEQTDDVEAGIQLLEALNCLESVDRRFQERCRTNQVLGTTDNGAIDKHGATRRGRTN